MADQDDDPSPPLSLQIQLSINIMKHWGNGGQNWLLCILFPKSYFSVPRSINNCEYVYPKEKFSWNRRGTTIYLEMLWLLGVKNDKSYDFLHESSYRSKMAIEIHWEILADFNSLS